MSSNTFHVSLNVSSIPEAVARYRKILGAEPAKVREDYAKFEVADPALNLTLNTGERNGALGAFNHAGIQVESTDEVLAARLRLQKAGLATFDEMDTTCCYAKQDKIWVHDPDGTPWEVFTVLDDAPVPGEPEAVACC